MLRKPHWEFIDFGAQNRDDAVGRRVCQQAMRPVGPPCPDDSSDESD